MTEAPDREPNLADHPGRPRGRDEVDPELIVLPRPRASVGPLLALSVIVFCVYFLVRLKSDLVFAHAGDEPERLAGVAAALGADLDSYVELRAVPDRAAIARVYASDARDGHRLAPVLGSGDKLWLLFDGSPWAPPPTYDESATGRVVRLGDLPFYDELRAYLARTRFPRGLDVRAALAALADKRAQATDVAGDPVVTRPDTPVTIVERAVGEARVTGFATERHPDENAWRAALERAGILAPGAAIENASEAAWSFRVPAPGGIEPIAAALVAAKLFAARAEPVDRTHRAAWRDLAVEGGDLAVAGGAGRAGERMRTASVTALLIEAERQAPPDARVLVTTDRPGDYWHLTIIYVVLGALTSAFAWALWRGLRPEREPASAMTPAEKGDIRP